jgi:hypothetical protein
VPGYVASRDWPKRRAQLAEVYAYMIEVSGGYCGAGCDPELGCGARSDLQLHHLEGKPWTANKVGPLLRMRMLADDFVRGRLGVLCGDCNLADGHKHAAVYRAKKTQVDSTVPF